MKTFKAFLIFSLFSLLFVSQVSAQAPTVKMEFEKGNVVSSSTKSTNESLEVHITQGSDKGRTIKLNYDTQGLQNNNISNGDGLVISKVTQNGKILYAVNDENRLPFVGIFIALFLALIVLVAGKKGVGSIIGLGISLGVIFFFIVPAILSGQNPLNICVLGAIIIILPTTYIAHGISIKTTIALISTLTALFLTWIIATFALQLTHLSGFGSEEAYDLHIGLKSLVDFRGLLLGGIIIATIGALNDITTTQSATIFELNHTDPKFDFDDLLKKGMSVGREHAVSLVNTLVLAFIGSSLALFILYFYNPTKEPLWAILNSEIISEEIIRTIVGTSGLLLSMPIVTILATFYCAHYSREYKNKS